MENASKENINIIFGLKVKQLRSEKGFSLHELSARSGVSASYLNEIENGKKYPKSDKIVGLANALDVPYDQLVSLKLGKTLSPVGQILNLDVLNELPFETFGIDRNLLTGLVSNAPLKVAALINTLYEIARNYNLKQEHFYFAALRSFQELNDNYFEDIEQSVDKFKQETGFDCAPPVSSTMYVQLLKEKYAYQITATDFADFPELQKFRSVYIKNGVSHLIYNARLTDQQKTFLFGRELGFSYLKLDKRPQTTSWLKVESFDHVLNNFKASYFAQALHIDKKLLTADIEDLFARTEWNGDFILALLDKYQASPEMLLQRMSNILPKVFGFNELFFIRYSSKEPKKNLKEISKELHVSRYKENFEARQQEQHFQRWVTKKLLEWKLPVAIEEEGSTAESRNTHISTSVTAIIATHPNGNEYFVVSILRPMPELNNNANSVTLGFQLTDVVKKKIKFLKDGSLRNQEILMLEQFDAPDSLKKLDEQKETEEAFLRFTQRYKSEGNR
jgi:transcriptional regulator with XRE-family HTH domain